MSYYYIVGASVDVPQIQGDKHSFDGTKKVVRLAEERPELGDVLTRDEAAAEVASEFWNGPHPGAA
jgi:hypothetical protein